MITDELGRIKRSYRKWSSMLRRIRDPKHPSNSYYKHLTGCDRWHQYENFLEDMGEPPEGLTLGRIDNTKGYCKENCRWETWAQQAKNRRPKATNPESLRQKAKRARLPYMVVYLRIRSGWAEQEALTTPKRQRGSMVTSP